MAIPIGEYRGRVSRTRKLLFSLRYKELSTLFGKLYKISLRRFAR